MTILAMMEGETLLYTLNGGGWFQWPDGAMASPAQAGEQREGWTLVEVVSPPPTFDEAKAEKIAALAYKRWQVETGGIMVGGAPVATDRDSQGLIGNAYQGALRHPDTIIKFKSLGGWVMLDAATMIAIGDAAFFHVQACFERESVLSGLIEAATNIDALNAIDITTGWPANI